MALNKMEGGGDFYRNILGSPRYVVAPMVDASELAWRMLSKFLSWDHPAMWWRLWWILVSWPGACSVKILCSDVDMYTLKFGPSEKKWARWNFFKSKFT